ncbi:hypothetical protein SAMN05216559_1072 [Halomicrobium zhouii]|uniref:DUF7344 domain-containing protein n=1 Tax=Halomicrobium zhouii TaxID=767519 RepID=A0A1I6KMQ0_9EURY|nr:hypothetical protein SAMN05216559_1072 [Halomicrobium zhouii]
MIRKEAEVARGRAGGNLGTYLITYTLALRVRGSEWEVYRPKPAGEGATMRQSTHRGTSACERVDHLSDSEYHQVLSSDRRRTTLEVLAERTTPVDLEGLAVAVATRENDADDVADAVVTQVASTLHHIHLPKLARFGVVEYDANAARIET